MTMKTPLRLLVLALLVSAGPPANAAAAAAAPDPIEGKWFGLTGSPQDRVETGFEFRRNEKQEIKAYLYRPVINVYGAELPGVVARNGDGYVLKELGLAAVLRGDRLDVTRADPPTSFSMTRTRTLPADEPVPDLPPGPGPKWQVKLGGAIYAPVAVRDGVAYAGTTGGVLDAVRIEDGSFVWAFSAGRPIHGEALVDEEHLYFVCDNGFLFKLDRKTGKELWRYDLGDARVPRITQVVEIFGYDYQAPRPALAGGVVYVGAADGGFHAVSAATGQRVWRFEAKGKIRDNALVDGPRVVFGTLDGLLYAVDRATGKEAWKQDLKGDVTSSPVLAGGKLIVGTRGSTLYALRPETGETLWKQSFWGSWVESTAVPHGDLFYIGSSDLRRAAAYDPKDGRVVWRTDVYGSAWGRPLVTDTTVFVGAEGTSPYTIRHLGSLCALDRRSGRIVWRWPVPALPGVVQTGFAAGPALDGGTLVIGGLDGSLYAFRAG
jgi:outer membrane protein assembly factor BamB